MCDLIHLFFPHLLHPSSLLVYLHRFSQNILHSHLRIEGREWILKKEDCSLFIPDYISTVRGIERCDQAKQGALSRSCPACDSDPFTFLHFKGNVIKYFLLAKTLCQGLDGEYDFILCLSFYLKYFSHDDFGTRTLLLSHLLRWSGVIPSRAAYSLCVKCRWARRSLICIPWS